jgi:hypothetical protein
MGCGSGGVRLRLPEARAAAAVLHDHGQNCAGFMIAGSSGRTWLKLAAITERRGPQGREPGGWGESND